MKNTAKLFSAAALIAFFSLNAQAAQVQAPAAAPTAAPKAAQAAVAAPAAPSAPAAKPAKAPATSAASSAADWQNICKYRMADAEKQKKCLERNKDKVGKPLTEAQSKQAADGAAGKVRPPKKHDGAKGKHAKAKTHKKKS